MEKTTVLKTGKYISIIVMLLTGSIALIGTLTTWLNLQDWGYVVIAICPFLLALRGYLKDHNGVE